MTEETTVKEASVKRNCGSVIYGFLLGVAITMLVLIPMLLNSYQEQTKGQVEALNLNIKLEALSTSLQYQKELLQVMRADLNMIKARSIGQPIGQPIGSEKK